MHRLRTRLAALLTGLLLLTAAGCSSQSGKSQADAPQTESEQESKGDGNTHETEPSASVKLPLSYSDPKTGIALSLPDGWTANAQDGAVVALISPQNGNEDFFRENVLITADDQFQNLTMDAYLKAMDHEVRQRYADTKTEESGEIEIDGLKGHWQVDAFTGTKGLSRVYRVVLIRETVAYVFHATAPAYTFDRYRPVFEAIARSIHWS